MRKILFTLLAVGAMLAAIPAASLAHGGDHHQGDRHREREHQREHRHARHDDWIQHERFGGHDGIGQAAGTVSAFANGRLTIHLNDGSSVTGAVDRFSEIECEVPHQFMRPADQGQGGSGSGSSGGPGNDNGQDGPGHNAGDDNGQDGPGHNAGDDNGQGDLDNDPGDDNGDRRCTTIAPGMAVRDATLTVTSLGAGWTRVDLIDS
jgi:hypothetical protein